MRAPTFIPQSPSKRDQYIGQQAQFAKTLRASESAGVRTSHTTLGVVQEVVASDDGGSSSSTDVAQLLVSDVFGDYLYCRRIAIDSAGYVTIESDRIIVAKPHEARRSIWDLQTLRSVSYANTGGTAAQSRTADLIAEELTPSYLSKYSFVTPEEFTNPVLPALLRGAIICAIDTGENILTADNESVTWLDINDCGRQFLKPATNNVPHQFYIDTIANNYVGAFPYDSVTGAYGTRINIARPPELRGGDSRTFGTGAAAYTELIDPPYQNGDVIYAFYVPDKIDIGDGQTANWIDANVDARRWELPKRSIAVCDDGVTKYIVMRSSPPLTAQP